LLEATTERLWLVGDGKVTNFEGDLDDYRRLVLSSGNDDTPRKADSAGKDTRAEQRRASASKRAELKPLQKKIKDAEAEVTKLTALLEKIDGALADNDIYVREPTRAAELSRQRAETVAALASAEEQWLELSGEYESAMAAE
jgi:ATP-binding cassette subfamily F protein 3